MERTIEIEDTLDDTVKMAIEEAKDAVKDYATENNCKLEEELDDCFESVNDNGRIDEIIDGSVPIYTSEIEGLWYLYKGDFEEAYENAGFGDNPLENNGMTAIYCYISDKVNTALYEWKEELVQVS